MRRFLWRDRTRPCEIAVLLKSDDTVVGELPRTIEVCELHPGGIVSQTALIITAPVARQFLPLPFSGNAPRRHFSVFVEPEDLLDACPSQAGSSVPVRVFLTSRSCRTTIQASTIDRILLLFKGRIFLWKNRLSSCIPSSLPEFVMMTADLPTIGDEVYVPQTDVVHKTYIEGGLGVVTETWEENGRLFLSVEELPDASFAWDFLAGEQHQLKQRYGESRAGQYMLGPGQPFFDS